MIDRHSPILRGVSLRETSRREQHKELMIEVGVPTARRSGYRQNC